MIHVTAAIIFNEDNRILLAQREKTSVRPLLWELPGGKQEPGEDLRSCLKRELLEEFEIQVEVGPFFMKHRHAYPDLELMLHAFYIQNTTGEFQLKAHRQIQWVSVNEFFHYSLAEADIPILEALAAEIP